jgi:predicted N-formylglutamate amidohydrolase
VTCEHGGNEIPPEFRSLFKGHAELLQTHRGYDPGALELANAFARELQSPLHFTTISRLLIEQNRSLGHPQLFSKVTKGLDGPTKGQLIETYYAPYRARVIKLIEQAIRRQGTVLHLSVHSFTPVLDGDVRRADVGLLYDPGRSVEKRLADRWIKSLRQHLAELVVRRNYPYRGTADGLTTWLRKRFGHSQYSGIELEINQRFPLDRGTPWRKLQNGLVESLRLVQAEQG